MDLFDHARDKRDEGMQRAAEHADAVHDNWTVVAYSFLLSFARRNEFFISEEVSGASKEALLPQPPSDRAWGSVYTKARKSGIIVQDGFGRSARRHASICPRWRSRIFVGAA